MPKLFADAFGGSHNFFYFPPSFARFSISGVTDPIASNNVVIAARFTLEHTIRLSEAHHEITTDPGGSPTYGWAIYSEDGSELLSTATGVLSGTGLKELSWSPDIPLDVGHYQMAYTATDHGILFRGWTVPGGSAPIVNAAFDFGITANEISSGGVFPAAITKSAANEFLTGGLPILIVVGKDP